MYNSGDFMKKIIRCDWANKSELEQKYHDEEWGIPVHDDKKLFKMLILEGKQAGLSWTTILSKMDTLCEAFDDFDPNIIIKYDDKKVEKLLNNEGIIRNKLKINAVINNAKEYFRLCEEFGSLDTYLWSYVDNKPIKNSWTKIEEVPAKTNLSDKIKFIGAYSHDEKQIRVVIEDDLAKGKEIAHMVAEEIKKKINIENIQ